VVTITPELADRIAGVARLLLSDDNAEMPLQQLTELALELIPGSTAAGIVAAGEKSWTSAVSDPRLNALNQLQFDSGDGPLVEALRHGESRRIDDTAQESRWPAFCQVTVESGFGWSPTCPRSARPAPAR
jgi:hypothetical protein